MIDVSSFLKTFNVKTMESCLRKRVFDVEVSILLLGAVIGLYTLVFSYFTILKDLSFRTYAWDLGIFNQAFSTTVNNGKFFYYTPELLVNPSGSFFGVHFSPILFLVLPFYAIFPASHTLLVMQSFVLALGAVPLYKLSVHALRFRLAAIVLVFVYLIYPPLQGINWFDFHVQAFLPLFFLSTIYFYERRSWKTYFLFIFLSLMVEEHASLIVLFIGVYGLARKRDEIVRILRNKDLKNFSLVIPVITAGLGFLWYIMTFWVRDSFFPINPDFVYEFNAAANWSVLGVQSPLLIPFAIFLFPSRAIAAISYDFLAKSGYLLILFGPLAFKSFSAMKHLLPTLPWFVLALFSNYVAYYTIYNQYPAYVIAFVFVAAVFALKGKTDLPVLKKDLKIILVIGLTAFLLVSPISPVVNIVYPSYGFRPPSEHESHLQTVLEYVPSNASILTQSNIFPHVSSRIDAYAIPVIHQIWAMKAHEFKDFAREIIQKVEYILVDFQSDPFSSELVFPLIEESQKFQVFVSDNGIVLFKRNYLEKARVLSPYMATYWHNNLYLYSGERIEDPSSKSETVMYINGESGPSPLFWFGPRCLLPPGNYSITLRLKVDATEVSFTEIFTLELCSSGGQDILISKTFLDSDFSSSPIWENRTINISLNRPIVDFEVRASNISGHADIYLDFIDVKQINSQ